MSLSPAEAWALASKVALIDARHCDPLESAEKREEALELMVRARTLDPDPCLLINAQTYLEREVKPAAHYSATPVNEPPPPPALTRYVCSLCGSGAVHKTSIAVYGTCRDCGQGHMRRQGKPTRRRGTKPASLPQLLSAAAHAIKEP